MSRVIGLSFLPLLMRFPAPTCAAGCDTNLPAFEFDDCIPKINLSEIRRIFFAKKTAANFANVGSAAEWLTRQNQSNTLPDAIRTLTVIADKPAGTSVVKEISNGRKITVGKDQVVNFTIDDVSDANYNAMRQLECGGEYKFWFETEGGYIYGGNEGIIASVDVNNVLGRGREEIETIIGSFSWRAKFSPERVLSPIFGTGSSSATLVFNSTIQMGALVVASLTGTGFVDADQKFQFNSIASPSGTGITCEIKVGDVSECTIDGPSDYVGKPFRYTDKAGVIHNSGAGGILDGIVNF